MITVLRPNILDAEGQPISRELLESGVRDFSELNPPVVKKLWEGVTLNQCVILTSPNQYNAWLLRGGGVNGMLTLESVEQVEELEDKFPQLSGLILTALLDVRVPAALDPDSPLIVSWPTLAQDAIVIVAPRRAMLHLRNIAIPPPLLP